tara:strand:- start:411 stop:767 length:357 start_codon:yes stop_codon:yes gene_type:complete
MQDNNFDPEIFKQAAQAMAANMTQAGAEKAQSQKIMTNIREQVDTAATIVCESCGAHVFNNSFVLKRISAITSPTGEEMVVPVQIFACASCNGVNKEFLPSHVISDVTKADENGIPTY